MKLGSKSENLKKLEGKLRHAKVLPQFSLNAQDWNRDRERIFLDRELPDWISGRLIARSSASGEDSADSSMAGHFCSVLNIEGQAELENAIDEVVASFKKGTAGDQVFIQPMLSDVMISGVAFTRNPSNGSDFYVLNYDESSGSTESVTAGTSNELRVYYHARSSENLPEGWLGSTLKLLQELEERFQTDALDVEFAVNTAGQLYLFQVRPLVMRVEQALTNDEYSFMLFRMAKKVRALAKPHPYLLGKRSIFGVMPDWNPAEILGTRPRPLALSLYKELITDNIWAYQRANYGYRNIRSFPLLVSFEGLPYIDVRVSFNSFIPADLDKELAAKLVDSYVDQLIETPSFHDKVEFEIIHSCYTLDMSERMDSLKEKGFSDEEAQELSDSLLKLTNRIIHNENGLWIKDTEKIRELQKRQQSILESELNDVEKIYWLLEDCKRYGTLPFAGLARAGFIAVQLLRSMVHVGVLSEDDYERFMNSLDTGSARMTEELRQLDRASFLKKYGHLRPGTYDLLSPRYDQAPDDYFSWEHDVNGEGVQEGRPQFAISLESMNLLESMLKKHGFEQSAVSLLNFIKSAIEGREFSKFVFTKSLSDSMEIFARLGTRSGFSREEMTYADISLIPRLYASCENLKKALGHCIEEGKRKYSVAKGVNLPPLITSADQIYGFHLPKNEPNFITLKSVTASVIREDEPRDIFDGNILMIPSADPGYDWVFSHNIGGLITMYGGTNSHMAIRAGELGIPAVIGAGEVLYKSCAQAKRLALDCANRSVTVLQ